MKKAKIDVLDIADAYDEKPSDGMGAQRLDIEEPQIDLESESFLVAQEEEFPKKSFLTWKTAIIFGIPAVCVLLIVVAVLVYYLVYDKKTASKDPKGVAPVMAIASPILYDNLTAVVNDPSGKQRLVMFGIALKPGKGAGEKLGGSDQDIRIAASRIVGGAQFPDLMNEKGREQIKKKIKDHIENIKGAGVVESVWITSWTIL